MITYGHENFIEEAINGVLMQECDFELELIVANDCSPDRTDEVILGIIENHPRATCIKYVKHENNLGMMSNFIYALQQCEGEFIALCEGDDYWTDSKKLQKQVDFLKSNLDYVLCFHKAEVIKIVKNKKQERRMFYHSYDKTDYTANDVLNSWLIPTASMVFRNVITNFPAFLREAFHGDVALQVYLCEYGKMRFMDDSMSVYRINDGSVTVSTISDENHFNKLIKQYELMNLFFGLKYKTEINRKLFLLNIGKADSYKYKSIIKQSFWFLKTITLNPMLACMFSINVVNSIKALGVSLLTLLNIKKN
jgi:glycosyltransferase involved in cell wall biosynthesis